MEPDRTEGEGREVEGLDELLGEPSKTPGKVRSPLRMKYHAEIEVFRARFGSLEKVRENLGLSRRQICQLLMVDPSAWTRWMRDETKVPPHIYRSLEWYLILENKLQTQPDLAELFTSRFRTGKSLENQGFQSLKGEVERLSNELRWFRRFSFALAGLVAAFGAALLLMIG